MAKCTDVEICFLKQSGHPIQYPEENIPIIQVMSSKELGMLTALRFLEWVLEYPTGVVALPTGKTSEYFIKSLLFYKQHWNEPDVQRKLNKYGFTTSIFPDTSELKFVQIDEFVPIEPERNHSFISYIKRFYFPLLDLQEKNILTFDQFDGLELNQLCKLYEYKIRQWGGIGFFLGGIGPDGHIAFNLRGTPFNSTTHVTVLNYESAAATATGLGGIEFARNKPVVTMGLQTIVALDATIIIMAAGQGKSETVSRAVEDEQSEKNPASILQGKNSARFYITSGAARNLKGRQIEQLKHIDIIDQKDQLIDGVLIEIALEQNKKLESLTKEDILQSKKGKALVDCLSGDLTLLIQQCRQRILNKISRGLKSYNNLKILHTEPHHDDIMLSYYPFAVELLKNNSNKFATVTSGFNAVSSAYMYAIFSQLTRGFLYYCTTDIFQTSYDQLLEFFVDAYKRKDKSMIHEWELVLIAKKVIEIFSCTSIEALHTVIRAIDEFYQAEKYKIEPEPETYLLLKGRIRETEIDRLWSLHDIDRANIIHMRSRFYTNDIFSKVPTQKGDIEPMLTLINDFDPDIITLAFDPQGTGPDTHYKVLQIITQALRIRKKSESLKIWGYRNVWYKFSIDEATHIIPICATKLESLHKEFMTCFSTQKSASYPSHEFDGPFSLLSCSIQQEQLRKLKTLLGDTYFSQHFDERMHHVQGLLFLEEMSFSEFLNLAEKLASEIE